MNFPDAEHGPERRTATCHVYYRVRAGQMPQAGEAVAALINELHARTGIRGTLSRRIQGAGVAHALPTWMETYAGIDDHAGFERHMEAAVLNAAFAQYLPDGATRAVEWFEPLVRKDAA